MKNQNRGICIWLGVIALLLLCGVVLFAAYVYKFDPLSLFTQLFQTDAGVIWSALSAIATIGVGIATVAVYVKIATIQEGQANTEKEQYRLMTEPHILIDSLKIQSVECEYSSDKKEIKTVKGVDYPYYINTLEDVSIQNMSIITVTIINTSEAFARLRFDSAIMKHDDTNIVAKYNASTFGTFKDHIMLAKGESGKVGLLINDTLIDKLRGTQLTISTFLDNNYQDSFKDVQNYQILNECDGAVSFLPFDMSKNSFTKIDRSK